RRRRLHVREQPVADVIDAKLAVIDLAVLGAAVVSGENLDVLSFRSDPLVELLRLGDGTIRSFSPCSTRNAHSIRCATPSSVNFFAHSSAVSLSGAPTTQRNWKIEVVLVRGSAASLALLPATQS